MFRLCADLLGAPRPTHSVSLRARAHARHQRSIHRQQALLAVEQLLLPDRRDEITDIVLGVARYGVQVVGVLVRSFRGGFD